MPYDVGITNNYIDFDAAYASLSSQSESLLTTSSRLITEADIVYRSYEPCVYIQGGERVTLSDNIIDKIKWVILVQNASTTATNGTVINIEKSGDFTMPGIRRANNNNDFGTDSVNPGEYGEANNGTGISVVWNVPYANRLEFANSRGEGLGHVLAVNADVINRQGNYSGCQIVGDFDSTSEGHMWPYNGGELFPTSTTIDIQVSKTVNGDTPGDRSYTFIMEQALPVSENAAKYYASNDADGNIKFESIQFNQAGTYTYKIYEDLSSVPGNMTADKNIYYIDIVVSNFQHEGNDYLSAEKSDFYLFDSDGEIQYLGNEVTFDNQYKNGKASLKLVKTDDAEGSPLAGAKFDLYKVLENSSEKINEDSLSTDENGEILVNDLQTGFYYFLETEAPEDYILPVGDAAKTKVIEITENDVSNMVTKSVYAVNTPIKKAGITIQGSKELKGHQLEDQQFEFQLLNSMNKVIESVKNDSNGRFRFSELTYDQNDLAVKDSIGNIIGYDSQKDFTYTVKEVNDAKKGYSYSDIEYKVVITVSNEGADNGLSVSKKIMVNNGIVDEIVFINTYQAEGTFTPRAKKILYGKELQDGQFSFKLETAQADWSSPNFNMADVTFETVEGQDDVKNDTMGNITFSPIYYQKGYFNNYQKDDTGKYILKITENIPDSKETGYTYTETPIFIYINVSSTDDDRLTVQAYKDQNGNQYEPDQATLINQYMDEGILTLGGKKNLEAGRRTLKNGEFSFKLEGVKLTEEQADKGYEPGNSDYEEIETVRNRSDGMFSFTPILYKQNDAGIYYYRISEIVPSSGVPAGYTYDTSTLYTIKTIVTETEKDGLNIVSTINNSEYSPENIVFTNLYQASASYTLSAQKNLTGQVLQNGQFTFELKDQNGNILDRKSNTAEGNIVFDPINYTESDIGKTYLYTVNEVLTDKIDGITYDETNYSVTVTVVDNGDGTLSVTRPDYTDAKNQSPLITKNGTATEQIIFNNVSSEKEETGKISVTKKVSRLDEDFESIPFIRENTVIYYTALFKDAEGKERYTQYDIKQLLVPAGSSEAATVIWDDLPLGVYYVFETDAHGNAIPFSESQTETDESGNIFIYSPVTEEGSTGRVELSPGEQAPEGTVGLENIYTEIPDGYSLNAEIEISKKVLKGGISYDTDTQFYATVFTQNSEGELVPQELLNSELSEDDGEELPSGTLKLVNNGTVTVQVPLGGENQTEPITYYVRETNKQGEFDGDLDPDIFAFNISGEGEVTLSAENTNEKIELVNEMKDRSTEVHIQKVDESENPLAGAKFQLIHRESNKLAGEWTSTTSARTLTLIPGTYTLTELQAPVGYEKGKDTTISVSEDGTVEVSGNNISYNDELIKVVNKKSPSDPKSTPGIITTSGGTSGGTATVYKANSLTAVNTGDETSVALYLLLLGGTATTYILVLKLKRKAK